MTAADGGFLQRASVHRPRRPARSAAESPRSSRSSRPTSSRCRRSTSATTSRQGVDQLHFLAEATGYESVLGAGAVRRARPVRQRAADPARGARGARHRPQRAALPAAAAPRRRSRWCTACACASSPPTSAWGSSERQVQVRRLLARAGAMPTGSRLMLLGDFNEWRPPSAPRCAACTAASAARPACARFRPASRSSRSTASGCSRASAGRARRAQQPPGPPRLRSPADQGGDRGVGRGGGRARRCRTHGGRLRLLLS